MKTIIRISYHVCPYFRYILLIVCGGNSCNHVIKENAELSGYGPIMKSKDETHHVRVKIAEPKEDSASTER